jgi:hypothetical protein
VERSQTVGNNAAPYTDLGLLPRSAGFQPDVSPISNRLCYDRFRVRTELFHRPAGWKPCDTASWKPALLPFGEVRVKCNEACAILAANSP